MADDFLLTTANNLEGYIIVKQCGVVFGETVFKSSFADSLGAGLSNMVDSMRFKSTEMSGQMSLIENARDYAYEKLINAAKRRGANAVIAIDSDNTIGGNVMYISLYGTAVKVISIAEKEEYDRKEKERLAQEEEDKKKAEEARKAFLERMNGAREGGEPLPEEQFLHDIEELTSMMDVWKKWQEYGLDQVHLETDKFIRNAKDFERLYGRGDTPQKIKKLREILMGE